jgi:signal peptidase II
MSGAGSTRFALVRFLLPALLLALLDQGTKALVLVYLTPGESRPVLGPVLSLTRSSNTGALFGLFRGAAPVLTVVGLALAAAVVLGGWSLVRAHPATALPLALILGGALGNLTDRLARGRVVDFLDFHFWPVFNVADIALTLGVFLAAWQMVRTPAPAGRPTPPGQPAP